MLLRKFTFFFILTLVLGNLFSSPAPVEASQNDLLINEFMPYPTEGENEWIELFNNSLDSQDLSGMWIMVNKGTEPDYDYQERIDLSGTVPRNGFLTFSTDDKFPDDGACVTIFIASTSSIFSLKYGNGTCDEGVDPVDATGVSVTQGQSINAQESWVPGDESPQATWGLCSGDDITKGWCSNDECPSISTIVSEIGTEDVTTNLADQSDYSRTSGLYFEKTDYGKIEFLNEINFTDQDSLTWMQQLDENLDISQGVITLDADLIVDLVNTQASLSMYNITLDNPKILVDGQDDTEGIVSSLSYNTDTNILTFTAAHFTTFTATENVGLTEAGAPVCGDWPPSNAPHLFQIDTSKNSAVLYFTPANNHLSYYYIAYGYSEGDERFGVEFPYGLSTGVVSYTIGSLAPNTGYYFKVRGGNGCVPGPWSNWLMAKTETTKSISTQPLIEPSVLSGKSEETDISDVSSQSDLSDQEQPLITPQPTPYPTKPPEKLNFSVEEQRLSFWQKIFNFLRSIFKRGG